MNWGWGLWIGEEHQDISWRRRIFDILKHIDFFLHQLSLLAPTGALYVMMHHYRFSKTTTFSDFFSTHTTVSQYSLKQITKHGPCTPQHTTIHQQHINNTSLHIALHIKPPSAPFQEISQPSRIGYCTLHSSLHSNYVAHQKHIICSANKQKQQHMSERIHISRRAIAIFITILIKFIFRQGWSGLSEPFHFRTAGQPKIDLSLSFFVYFVTNDQ